MRKFANLRRPSHTTVVAYLSLFLVVTGGAAYAATKIGTRQLRTNSVTAAKIKRNAVTSTKIKDGAVTQSKVAANAIGGAKIAANAVGGVQADEASFQGLVNGNGSIQGHAFTVPAIDLLPTPVVLANIPGFGEVKLIYCGSFDQSLVKDQMGVLLVSAAGSQPFSFVAEVTAANNPYGTNKPEFVDLAGAIISNEQGSLLNAQLPGVETPGPFGIDARWDLQLSRGDDPNSPTIRVVVSALDDSTVTTPKGQCHISAQTTITR